MKGIRQPETDAGKYWLGRHPVLLTALSLYQDNVYSKDGTLGLQIAYEAIFGIDMKVFRCFRE
jgi:hypothetical protein